MKKRTYRGLVRLKSFEERFEYLKLSGEVADPTFGYNRFFNQSFYHSKEWKQIRDRVILRDNGCDLAMPGYELVGPVYIHHINPITLDILEHEDSSLLDLDNLVCVSFDTHNAIHYGTVRNLPMVPVERKPGDTCPWR